MKNIYMPNAHSLSVNASCRQVMLIWFFFFSHDIATISVAAVAWPTDCRKSDSLKVYWEVIRSLWFLEHHSEIISLQRAKSDEKWQLTACWAKLWVNNRVKTQVNNAPEVSRVTGCIAIASILVKQLGSSSSSSNTG